MNKVIVIGNLGQDPQINSTKSGKLVANFSLATSEKYRDSNGDKQVKTEWHRIVAWGKLAEIVEKFLEKGSKICVEGKLATRSWEDESGGKRYITEIIATNIEMLGAAVKEDAYPADDVSSDMEDASVPF